MPVHIVLADDHVLVRQGLRSLLEGAEFKVIGEAGDGQEAIRLVEKLHPAVAVLDIAMPTLNGIDAAREISRLSPETKTILLTMLTEDQYVLESLRAGVKGYVLKSNSSEELVKAIREVCQGKVYLTPAASTAVVQAYVAMSGASPPELTEREREVLQLVAEGKTSKEIAGELGITWRTVESHRTHIMEKLAIHDTAGLVHYAIRHGLVQL
jgi:two-component system, NarL family, response regulator NreC